MAPHEQRVVAEYDELFEKANKLGDFIGNDIYDKLDEEDQKLLLDQLSAMTEYILILEKRIKRFK